jgi:hypothetical protein
MGNGKIVSTGKFRGQRLLNRDLREFTLIKTGDGILKLEVGSWELGVRSWELGVGSWELLPFWNVEL